MALSLDGNISYIGTEFIKLLNTGSSHLATEQYVNDAIAEGGGGGGGDLSNYYTQTQTDNLLNNKLNVINPQDIIGNLRLDPTNGNSKIILNAVAPATASDDFYCNGNGQFNGSLRVSLLTSDGDVNCDGVNADVFNSNVITNDIVFNHNDNEYMRFQVSDNTVRVPNTKSFLSQNIFTDIVKPLAFSNDVVLNGGNNTNDAYEEYVRLDASAEKVSISKETKFENAIQLNQGQSIKWTNVFIREVQGATRPEFDLIVNGSTSHLRLWVNGAIKQAITNTTIACKVNIDAEQGLTVFTGQQLKTNTINSHTNSNLVIQRSGSTYMTFQSDRININQALHLSDTLFIDTVNKLSLKPSLEGGVNIFDIRNLHPVADNPMIRFRVGEGGGETIICEMTNNGVSIARNLVVGTAYELRTNALDTNGDNDLVISRNNIPFLTLDKFTEDTVEKEAIICSKQLRANGNILVNNLQINQFASGVEYADFRLHNADSVVRYFVGNSTNANFQITHAGISLNRETTIGSVKTNTINSNGNNDLVFQRNGTEIFKCETSAGIDNNDILNITPIGGGMSASNIYCNSFKNRTLTSDTVFYGANSAGDNRIEYMKWNRTDQSLDFNAPIDNTNIAVIGNIVDTTVSDERLKTNIQDVESNYCDCIKNVKIKTFEYKDEKYKDSDKYGFIAQHLQKHLPKEFDNIVKETKPKKDEGEAYLSINYMKLSVVLWGALQETLNKVEHLESRLFEAEDEIKALRGKGKGEKPKPKSKAKAKNID